MAYLRTARLYARAMKLDTTFSFPEVGITGPRSLIRHLVVVGVMALGYCGHRKFLIDIKPAMDAKSIPVYIAAA